MTVLCIILGIILFFVAVLSIRITLNGEYQNSFTMEVSWLFLHFTLFPFKIKKKPKKEEAPKPEEEPKQEENPTEDNAPKKDNIFVKFYKNQGFDGVMELVNNAAYSLMRLGNSLKKHIVFRKLYLWITVSAGDAAETALEYGRVCQKLFPALSFICSTCPVKKYDAEVEPDYLGSKNKAEFMFSVSVRPIFIINAVIALAFRLIFKVGIKFLEGIKSKKGIENNTKTNEII